MNVFFAIVIDILIMLVYYKCSNRIVLAVLRKFGLKLNRSVLQYRAVIFFWLSHLMRRDTASRVHTKIALQFLWMGRVGTRPPRKCLLVTIIMIYLVAFDSQYGHATPCPYDCNTNISSISAGDGILDVPFHKLQRNL